MKLFRAKFLIPVIISVLVVGGLTPFSFSNDLRISVTPEIEQAGVFFGHQVVEVKVSNPDFSDTTVAQGEQDVKVNGKILRMVQAIDGNWYGYFANVDQAQIADSTTDVNGEGTDFGTFCGPDSTILNGQFFVDVSDTVGIAVNSQDGIDGTDPPTAPIPSCDVPIIPDDSINVLDDVKQINPQPSVTRDGQIGMDGSAWPFIQLYRITEEVGVTIQYNVGGDDEFITLDYLEQFPSAEELVEIDIKPGSDPNAIQPFKMGVTPVGILSSSTFSAETVDFSTVTFGPDEATPVHKKPHLEDVNNDGLDDMVLHFKTKEIGIEQVTTELCLKALTFDGTAVEGCDAIVVVPKS